MKIIDSHVHFILNAQIRNTQDPWIKAEQEKWRIAWGFQEPEEITDFHKLAKLWIEETKKHNLEKVVFVTASGNEQMIELVKLCPEKFVGYAHHNIENQNAAELLEKALEQGLRGYKILGTLVKTPLNDPKFYPVWEVANKYEIPVLIHFGIVGAAGGIAFGVNINPLVIHDVAKNFKRIKFIIPHFGCGYLFETLNLCWACPNVYVDTSGSNQWMRWMPYDVNLETLFRKFKETIGSQRIIFGTDSSWFPRGFVKAYLDEQLKAMVYVGYRQQEIDDVLYGNISKILNL